MANFFSSLTDVISSSLSSGGHNVQSSAEGIMSTEYFRSMLRGYTLQSRECKKFIHSHLQQIKHQFNSNNSLLEEETAQLLEQCLICKAVGYDVSFSRIYAVQLAQSAQIWRCKVLAYEACSIVLTDSSDISILMVATLQRDIRTPNIRQICLALSCASDLINSELVPALDTIVTERTRHPSPLVRRKAVACIGSLIRKLPEIAASKVHVLKAALIDKDPHTAWIALQLFKHLPHNVLLEDRESLLKIFHHILQQAVQGKLPAGMKRGSVPAPLMIVCLIRLVKTLYRKEDSTNASILQLLLSCMDAFDRVDSKGAVCVVYECCITIPLYTSSDVHLDRISRYAGILLKSSSSNYKLTALLILGELTSCAKGLVGHHQSSIISELNAKDKVIASKSLNLIILLTSSANIKQVFQLYNKISNAPSASPPQDFQRNAIDILTCLPMTEMDSSWFVERLIEILNYGRLTETELDKLLNYLKCNNLSTQLYAQLKEAVKKSSNQIAITDLLSVWLWAACELTMNDSDLFSVVLGAIEDLESWSNPLLILVLIRRSLSQRLTILEADVDKLSKILKRLGHESLSYTYLDDIRKLCGCRPTPATKTSSTSNVLDMLNAYTDQQLKSGKCRAVSIQSTEAARSDLVFTPQPDTKASMKTSIHSGRGIKAAKVWTEKGRRAVTETVTASTSGGQPLDEVTDLANQIFSSM